VFSPDAVDVRLLQALVEDPRLTVSQLAERAGVVRNTAQSRLDRFHRLGVLGRNERSVDLHELGFNVAAVVSLSIRHAEIEDTIAALERNPSVLMVEEVAGSSGDLLLRVACRSTDDLQVVIHSLLSTPGVVSTSTQVVLKTRVPYRVSPTLGRLLAD
jgi:DNA-binding Lrp family transcriptional regulator